MPNACDASQLTDNNFFSIAHTNSEMGWMNVQLIELSLIKSVVIINRTTCCYNRIIYTSIQVGNNSNPNNNNACANNVDRDGVFVCASPLAGTFVGITKTSGGPNFYNIAELRAYSWVPFDELNSSLSADVMPNASLYNSVHITVPLPTASLGGLSTDTLFSTGPAVNCFWKMQLGESMHVKAVLIIGNYATQANT